MDTDKPVLTGLFRDRDNAERAYQSIAACASSTLLTTKPPREANGLSPSM